MDIFWEGIREEFEFWKGKAEKNKRRYMFNDQKNDKGDENKDSSLIECKD